MTMNVDTQDLLASTLAEIDEAIASGDSPFGLWISSLFFMMPRRPYDDVPFAVTQKLFLEVLRRLLDEGKVVALPPEEFYENGRPTVPCRTMKQFRAPSQPFENIWDVPSEEIIQYINDHWPEDIADVDDEKLNLFWYESYCPRIGWYDETTKSIVAS